MISPFAGLGEHAQAVATPTADAAGSAAPAKAELATRKRREPPAAFMSAIAVLEREDATVGEVQAARLTIGLLAERDQITEGERAKATPLVVKVILNRDANPRFVRKIMERAFRGCHPDALEMVVDSFAASVEKGWVAEGALHELVQLAFRKGSPKKKAS
jgi:hypothetical protein